MPAGPVNCTVAFGQTNAGPAMEQPGSGATLKTTLLVSVQPLACTTANCRVADAEETYAVVTSDAGESMVAIPATTLQAVDAIGDKPAVAVPFRAKDVEEPSVHRV